MSYARSAVTPRELGYPESRTTKVDSRGLLRRLLDAMIASRQRQTDREIARYMAGMGGKFTDDVEREIERRFLTTPLW